jgi:beta-barrel assembly-enhancing protease
MLSQERVTTLPSDISDYVSDLGKKIAASSDRPDLPYEFTVIDNPMVNAWCLPGGKIAINRGMLETLKTEGQLAFILAHEVAHANARHTAKSLESEVLYGGANFLLQPILTVLSYKESRTFEAEADRLGITYLQRSGYDPKEAMGVHKIFAALDEEYGKKEGFFETHPSALQRAAMSAEMLKILPSGGIRNTTQFEHMKQIVG